jgi:hypothetical protein
MSQYFTALLLCATAYGVSATPASCQIELDAVGFVCKRFPKAPVGVWFEDSTQGGPYATTAAACSARKNEWEADCKVNVLFKYTSPSSPTQYNCINDKCVPAAPGHVGLNQTYCTQVCKKDNETDFTL